MSDPPALRPGGSPERAEAPLGLALELADGRALLTAAPTTLAQGVELVALDLWVPDVEFPLDLGRGASRFKSADTRLVRLVLDLDLSVLAARLSEILAAADTPLRAIDVSIDRGLFMLEGDLSSGDACATLTASLIFSPASDRSVRVALADVQHYGVSNLPPERLIDGLRDALGLLLSAANLSVPFENAGLYGFSSSPLSQILGALMHGTGFKAPSYEDTSVVGTLVTRHGKLRLIVGLEGSRRHEADLREEDPLSPERSLRLLAREDAAELVAPVQEISGRDPTSAFQGLRSKLDASGGPRALLTRLLDLGISHPILLPEVADLIRDIRDRMGDDSGFLLADAQVSERAGDERAASEAYERAARALQREGHLRAAGHALIAAARVGLFDVERRARLADQAEALLPEHPRALAALAQALPDVDRVAQAVRAARRWAKVAHSQSEAAEAHVLAAELLRDRLRDLAQAKREFERALRIDPRHTRAMEGLARALVEQGDPRRASLLLEQLATRAESEGKSQTAARLSLALGDVWRRIDADAALVRYRRAAELDPRDPEPHQRVADTALAASRYEAALDALEEARGLYKQELVDLRGRGISGSVLRRAEERLAALHVRMGDINERLLDRPAEALACFEAAFALTPEDTKTKEAIERLDGRVDRRTEIAGRPSLPGHEDTLRIDVPTEDPAARAEALVRSGRLEEAIRVLTEEAPFIIENQERVAELAERMGRVQSAARALGRAATLAEEQGQGARAFALHARAATLFWEVGDDEFGVRHDRKVLEGSAPGDDSHPSVLALKRLERHARRADDVDLLCLVLERWSALETGPLGAECLVEKADLELRRLDKPEEAIETLKKARGLATTAPELRAAVEARLTEVLARVGDDEGRARLLSERAAAARDAHLKSRLLIESARLAKERAEPNETILEIAREALWSDPANEDARRFRTELMTAASSHDPLLLAAVAELDQATDDDTRVARALAIADEWVPRRRNRTALGSKEDESAMERAFELLRALPREAARTLPVQQRIVEYASHLRLAEDELLALGALADLEEDPVLRLRWLLRRAGVQRAAMGERQAAQAELFAVVDGIEGLESEARSRLEQLLRADGVLEEGADVLVFVIELGIALTRENEDWRAHLDYLDRALELTEAIGRRAALHFEAGEVSEWKLGDGDVAERQYLAALALDPRHRPAKEALLSFYLSADRFSDIAENLGVEPLKEAWSQLSEETKADRIIAAAEALWPRLPLGSEERGQVVLRLADLYRSDKDLPDAARLLLEEIMEHGPRMLEPGTRERLRTLYLEEGDFEHYVQILRKHAEGASGDHQRALALAELGEALEWKLGDGAGAEREYRAALAADPSCEAARLRLGGLLAAQDRFEELAADLGIDTLRRELNILLGRGPREARRAMLAARALVGRIPSDQHEQHWMRVGERISDAEAAAEAFLLARGQTTIEAPRIAAAPGVETIAETIAELPPPEPATETIEVPEAVGDEDDSPSSKPEVAFPRRDSYDVLTELRQAAESTPHDLDAIDRLLERLAGQEHAEMLAGPSWVKAFLLGQEPPRFAPLETSISSTLISAHILLPQVKSPLGRLLAHTAKAVAAILPPFSFPFAHRLLLDEPEVKGLLEHLEHQLEGRVHLQSQKGWQGVAIEPGEPPVVLVGDELLAEGGRDRLRYAIARSAFLLRHGYLLLSGENIRGQALDWVELLLRATDEKAEAKIPEPVRPALGPLRARLGPSGLAILETLAEQVGSAPSWTELEQWAGDVERSADRFGVVHAGTAAPAMHQLVEEAGLTGAGLEPKELVRSSASVTELLRFMIGADFSTLLLAARLPGGTGEA